MSKIYISSETLDKLNSSNDKQQYAKMLKAFDVKNQEPKIGSIRHSDNESSRDTKIKNALQVMMESLAKTRHDYTYSPQKAKELSQMLKEKKRKHQILKQYNQPATSFYPQSSNRRAKKAVFFNKATKKKSHISASYLKEHHLLTGGYASNTTSLKERYAKLRAKNSAVLQSCKKIKKKRQKRDWTDRFALK